MCVNCSRDSFVSFFCSLRSCFNRFFILQFRRLYTISRLFGRFWRSTLRLTVLLLRLFRSTLIRRSSSWQLIPWHDLPFNGSG